MLAMVWDTETTGLVENHSTRLSLQPEVIEVSCQVVDLDTGDRGASLDLLIRPTRLPLPEKIVQITGITDEDLTGAPTFAACSNDVFSFVERQSLIVAHNLSYDMELLDLEADRLGQKIAWPPGICTVEQTIHLRGYRLTLADLYGLLFEEKFAGAHRARADVEALCRVAIEMRRRDLI